MRFHICFVLATMDHRLIAHAAHSDDFKLRPFAEFAPQPIDVNVYRGIHSFGFHAPYFVHQLQAGEYLIGIGKQLI